MTEERLELTNADPSMTLEIQKNDLSQVFLFMKRGKGVKYRELYATEHEIDKYAEVFRAWAGSKGHQATAATTEGTARGWKLNVKFLPVKIMNRVFYLVRGSM